MPAVSAIPNKEVRTGRRYHKTQLMRALTSRRDLHLGNYIDQRSLFSGLPAYVRHGYSVPSQLPMYGNDRLGDCTCAALGHMVHILSSRDDLSERKPPTESDVIDLYWATGSQDTGRYMKEVLDYWRAHSLPSLPSPMAYVRVDPTNPRQVRTAIYLFGGVYIGIALPKAAQDMVTWAISKDQDLSGDYAPGTWGGHAINLQSYQDNRYGGVTWGYKIVLNQNFLNAYCDEMYAIIHPSWFSSGETPAGFNLSQLQSDLSKI